jgi:ATP-binding cassette subfamily B protein
VTTLLKTLGKQVKEFKKYSILTPIAMLLEVFFETLLPFMMASIVDDGIKKGDLKHVYTVGAIMLVAALGGLLSGCLGARFGARAAMGFGRNLRKAMFENIQRYSFANIDKYNTSGLVTRLTTDVTNVQNAYMMILRLCTRAPASLICAMVMSFVISPKLASIYLIAVIILGGILALIITKAMKYFQRAFVKYDDLNESVEENVSAIRVVKAYVREDYEKKKFKNASKNIYDMLVKAENIVIWNSPSMMLTVYTCIILISWFGAHLVVGSSLEVGELSSLIAYCMNILMSLMMLSFVFVMISMSVASARRIAEVIEEESTIKNPENPIKEVKNGSIEFKDVTFRYNEESEKPVLDRVSVRINSGETIGIIGATGSSKSSFVNLISRLYDVSSGEVLVGGKNVKEYDLKVLRDKVSVVLQKNVLFSGTILDNLRWGNKDATREECKEACILACADDFIEDFPDKYDTYIEQSGNNVSGGQKQRLCIARALLKKPVILILDDSTSAVDTATDAKIREAFRNKIPGTTKIIISQRISSVMDADRILVLENGQVNGFDSHENLLQTNKIYKEIFDAQSSGNGDFDEGGVVNA